MLSPLDLSTSQNNPKFALLHKRLTTLLGADGAVRLSAEESAKQAAVEEVLHATTIAAVEGFY